MIDPEEHKLQQTTDTLAARFDDAAAIRKQKQIDSLAKAREAKKQKMEEAKFFPKETVNDIPPVATVIPKFHDDLIWREAMVAQISSGRIVSPKQLPDASIIADAYLNMVKSKFSR